MASEKARAVYAHAYRRMVELLHTSRKASTVIRNQAVWDSIAGFAHEELGMDPAHIAPLDVVCWLIHADRRARTVFHKPLCPQYRNAAEEGCDGSLGCHTRLKHGAARTKVMQLRGWYRSAGLTSAWDTRTGTGNPCRAPQVDEYLSALLKEQISAGIHTSMASIMEPSLIDAMIRLHVNEFVGLLDEVRRGQCDPMLAYWSLQCATLLSFLTYVTDRSYDVARITFQDVDLVPEVPGAARCLRLRLGLNKTAVAHGGSRTITLRDPVDPTLSPVTLFLKLRSFRQEAGVELPLSGQLFIPKSQLLDRKGGALPMRARAQPKPLAHKHMQAILRETLQGLGPAYAKLPITPHAFRASGAARALADGVPLEEILHAFNWRDPQLVDHYVFLRTRFGYKGPFCEREEEGEDEDDDAF